MENQFYEVLSSMNDDPNVQQMKQFRHHLHTTTLDHVNNVAMRSYQLSRALHLKVDEAALARGAILHDYYLYDTRHMECSALHHGVHHPEVAAEKAQETFSLNDKEQDIIRCHMWPLTPTKLPHTKESWLVCMADKLCAIQEFSGLGMKKKK